MNRHVGLYHAFLGLRFKTLLQYRLDLIIGSLATLVLQGANFIALVYVVRNVGLLGGWSLTEIQLLYGTLLLSLSLNQMFADNLWLMTHLVRTGKLDTYLTRPVHPLFHLLAERFNHVGIGDFLTGAVLCGLAWAQLSVSVHPLWFAYWALSVLCGGLVFFSLNLLCSATAFWLLDSGTVTRVVFDNHQFAKYPLSIYPQALGVLLTWAIPYGLAAYHPVAALLGKGTPLPLWLPVTYALLLTALGLLVWNRALRRYSSTGS